MSFSFPWRPEGPDFRLDWQALDAHFDWIRALAGCPQDPEYHGEGDVWIHTRMVCESIAANELWRALTPVERETVFLAALLHDVGKPACTREVGGRLSSRGHSTHGAIMARELLWRLDMPFAAREQVASLIRYHQVPFFLIDHANAERQLFTLSQTARSDWLALVSEADARGRIYAAQQKLFDNIALFKQMAKESGCLSGPRQFESEHSRFLYFQKEDRDPHYAAFDDTICEVIVMSGLPGAGKDAWIVSNAPDLPVISLDGLRRELGISPASNQGPVIARARERAREFLRRRQPFIWNATNISREMRAHCLSLCSAYNARIRIVYVETSAEKMFKRNREREHRVPDSVVQRLLGRWEPPDITEAHRVEYVIS